MSNPILTAKANIGIVGDSLVTGNEGASGAVPFYTVGYSTISSAFKGSTPVASNSASRISVARNISIFDRGAPTWSIWGVDSQNIQQIRAFIANMPTTLKILFFEGGTNDITNSISPSVSNAQLIGAMNDAIARFPALQAFYYVGVSCIGELYQTVNGVSTFSGNAFDSAIDSLMPTLFASVRAQTGTNALGQPIQFIPLDMRATCIAQLAASGNPPPWQNAGYLTVDGRHPKIGGLPVAFNTISQANLTLSPP